MPFINYTKSNVHTISSYDGKEQFTFKPGFNEVPEHIWNPNANDPEIKQFIADGVLVVASDKIKEKVGNKTVTKVVGANNEEVHLTSLPEARAIEISKSTYNRDLLQRWIDEETRHKVRRALEKQIKPLLNDGSSEEDEGEEKE